MADLAFGLLVALLALCLAIGLLWRYAHPVPQPEPQSLRAGSVWRG